MALSALVLLVQLFAPALAAASGAQHSLLCNPSGQVSAETQAALDEFKDLLGLDDTDDDAVMDCEDCVTSAFAIAAPLAQSSTSEHWARSFVTSRSHRFTMASPRGPPLGSRAPPLQLVT